MNPTKAGTKSRALLKSFAVAGLGLAFCAVTMAAAPQQNQNGDTQGANPPTDSQQQAPPPSYAPSQDAQPPQGPPPDQSQPEAQAPPNQAVPPATLTIPEGTLIRVRVQDWISTDRSVIGDMFSAELDQPIVVNGWVVARRGQSQTGRVSLVKKGHGGGSSELGLELPGLTLVDGQQLQTQTQLYQTSAGTDHGRDAAIVGTTTGMGAVIGAIAGRGVGAAIGAGVGATAGIAGVMSTPGKPTVIAPETVLSFRLQGPITISTANSQFAFRPVSQADYDSHSPELRPRPRMVRPGPPPPPYYYPRPYGYPYASAYPYPYEVYPGPVVGFGYYGRFGGWR
jgi:hypothetical protein